MGDIRVIVIHDTKSKCEAVTDMLNSDKRIKVMGEARNMEAGMAAIKKHQPDVAIVDVTMSYTCGINMLSNIMKQRPLPVLMFSDDTTQSAADTVKAIASGAVDFIRKPPECHTMYRMKDDIINKVMAMSQAKINQPMVKKEPETQAIKFMDGDDPFDRTIIAIGASTGGPRALEEVLSHLPNPLPAPVLIVQHIPSGFTKSLARRLNSLMSFTVKEAGNNEVISNNTVYIAPGDFHMQVTNRNKRLVIELSGDAALRGHRPSVDVLLYSMADMTRINKMAVILTGMGRDGAEGIRKLKTNDPNAVTIAEAEETAIIYGMPKAAVHTNCVDHVLPLPQIGRVMANIISKKGGN